MMDHWVGLSTLRASLNCRSWLIWLADFPFYRSARGPMNFLGASLEENARGLRIIRTAVGIYRHIAGGTSRSGP